MGQQEDRRLNKARMIVAALGDISPEAARVASPATRRRIARAAGYQDVSDATWAVVVADIERAHRVMA